ncbi:MAG: HD-GYP domain-containing protein [Anaerolineales bacterium]
MINLSQVLNTIFVAAMLAIAMIAINVLSGGVNYATLSVAGLFFFTAGLYWVYNKGYIHIAGVGLVISISIVVLINMVASGGINDNSTIVFPLLITIGGLVLGKRFIPYLTGLFLAEIGVLYWLTVIGRITPFGGAITVLLPNFLTLQTLLLICGVVIWITVDTLERNFKRIIDSEIKLRESYDQTIKGWGKALELFDRETEGHSLRVIELTLKMGEKLGLDGDELEHNRRGALLHDIGKMGVDEILLNKPESLTDEERREVEKHPLNAHKLLKDIPFLEKSMDIPVYHHERWDGTGYPFRLAGEEIPLAARIFAIVDNWDALRADRPYRKAWPKDKVLQYLRNQEGKKFDPALVKLFIDMIE